MLVDYEESSWATIGNSSQIFLTDENDDNEDHHHQNRNGDGPFLNIIPGHQSQSAANPHTDFVSFPQPALFPHHQCEQLSSVYNHHQQQHSVTSSYPPHQSIMLLQDSSDGGSGGYMVVPKREDGVAVRLGLNLGHRTYFSAHHDDFISRLYRRSRPGLYESSVGIGGSANPVRCQAEGCGFDLSNAKHYHRRHKVCEFHSKASTVRAAGLTQRFCQQCSRFHLLSEFDNGKRSCRKRLADHNKRRRKSSQQQQQHVNEQDHQRRQKPHHRENDHNSSSETHYVKRSPPESAMTHSSSSVTLAAISPSRVSFDRYQQMSYQELPSSSSSLFYPRTCSE